MAYQPTNASLSTHPLPRWFEDAKLGIFVHWGVQSVPAWAPTTGELTEVIAQQGWKGWFANNPYADWYLNTIQIAGSPSQQHHIRTYGAGFEYPAFAPMFREATRRWDPSVWAELFRQVGARYVVLTTKHHDGFLLWPSDHRNPNRPDYCSERDLVGELAAAVRARGLRMGLYYSGGIDWSFDHHAIQDAADVIAATPQGKEYATYVDRHWRELIDRYQPSILWNDISYPADANLLDLLAYYYNAVPDGVVNDRFPQFRLGERGSLRYRISMAIVHFAIFLLARLSRQASALPTATHADFRTPEYATFAKIVAKKWEATRGLGYSFCYNRNETDEHIIPVDRLVRLFVDIVSKNGNLLLNVGPMADGTIPDIQLSRLVGLGEWLQVNGEAIFDTRPWVRAEGQTAAGIPIRFTQAGDALYAILLGTPPAGQTTIEALVACPGTRVHLLGHDPALPWTQRGNQLTVDMPAHLAPAPAHVLRIAPHPRKA